MFTVDETFKCMYCNKQYTHARVVCTCRKSVDNNASIVTNRERTPGEIEEVIAICLICPHRIDGLCGKLIRSGCGSCKSASEFASKIRRGIGCPDKPARFPATPLITLPTQPKSNE